jgi:hypothetical protein
MNLERARAWLRWACVPGALLALACGVRALDGPWTRLAEALLVVGTCVVVPLGVALALPRDRRPARGAWTALAVIVPLGGACAALSLWRDAGDSIGVVLACAFLASTLAVAWLGVARFLAWGGKPREELAVDVGLVSLVVSGVWLVVDRSGRPFMGFAGPVVLMTAVHFVFAGFAASVIAGAAGRITRMRTAWGTAAFIVAIGPALVGVGLTASPLVEAASAIALALGMLLLGIVLATLPHGSALARALLVVASACLVITMAFAATFAMRRVFPDVAPSWERMAHFHGVLNALGFSLSAIVALTILDVRRALPARAPSFGVPFSRFTSRWRVTVAYFEERGFIDTARASPAGLIDSLAAFAHAHFDPRVVDDEVRAFYERTATHGLLVRPRWRRGFATLGRVFRRVMRSIGQLGLPVDATDDDEMTARIVPLDDGADGRPARGAAPGVRGWLRHFNANGDTLYAAAYGVHVHDGVPYMNIGFPMPFSNFTSVLRVDPLTAHMDASRLADGGRGGLAVTTKDNGERGDVGVYLATPLGAVRLPIDETVCVWSARHGSNGIAPIDVADARNTTVYARHSMWLFGVCVLELDYFLIARSPI